MKIILITMITPASENIRGTSALPYHLIKGSQNQSLTPNSSPKGEGNCKTEGNIEFEIYTFNANGLSDEKMAEVEKELKCTIKKVPLPKWYQWMFKLHLLFLRVFLRYPFSNYITLPRKYVETIKSQNPDLIWVMGEELSRIVKQFPGFRRIQIGPDTESLYYYRMMGQRFVMSDAVNYWKCALMYRKYARMERAFCTDENFTYYAVGEEDIRHLQQLNSKVRAKFLRHPHYEVSPKLKMENGKLKINFHRPKIKVVIAGRYDLYMKQSADELVESLTPSLTPNPSPKGEGNHEGEGNYEGEGNNIHPLGGGIRGAYTFTFLGKGWETHVDRLRSAGYEVDHIVFAPDYIEEISRYDIQITPITIGTGTKGKVLDAMANGLLVIGTPYALENIAVEHGVSCLEYRHPEEVIAMLQDIPGQIGKYEEIAEKGRLQVITHHSRVLAAQNLFSFSR